MKSVLLSLIGIYSTTIRIGLNSRRIMPTVYHQPAQMKECNCTNRVAALT